jgi:hypothetical protein
MSGDPATQVEAAADTPSVSASGKLNGVGSLLMRVIEEKLDESPAKRAIFDRLDLNVFVHVIDVGQSASVEFAAHDGHGSARVSNGRLGKPDLRVECDHDTFIQFTLFSSIFGGWPNFFDDNGRTALRKIAKRQLVIRGMVRHSPGLLLFLRFLTITDE